MTRTDRRQALQLAIGAALAPMWFVRTANAAPSARIFAPPASPMAYQRTVRRDLIGGAQLSISRSFSVRFVHEGSGFAVFGEQDRVSVDAPAGLEAFARLERERVEDGIFPLLLDRSGHIISGTRHRNVAAFEQAVVTASERLEEENITGGERATLAEFVEAVHRAGASLTTELPHDLFAPDASPVSQHHTVVLPGGGEGEVSTLFAAEADPTTGLMRHARREVVTDLAGDRRRTVESWELRPA